MGRLTVRRSWARRAAVILSVSGLLGVFGVSGPGLAAGATPNAATTAIPSAANPPSFVHFYPPGSDCATAAKCVATQGGSAFVANDPSGKADPFTLGYQICGIAGTGTATLGTLASAGVRAVDAKADDPQHYNSKTFLNPAKLKNPDGTSQSRSKGSEGNYPNAEVFTFQAQSAALGPGDTINVALPRSSAAAGSVLPPPTTSLAQLGVSVVQTRSTVTYGAPVVPEQIDSPDGSQHPNYNVVTVELATNHDDQTQLDAYDAGSPPPVGSKVGAVSIWGMKYNNIGQQYWSAQGAGTATADPTTISGSSHRFATFYVASGARTVVFVATDATSGTTVGRTLTLTFGSPSAPSGPCASAPAAPSTDPQVAYNYLLVDEGHSGGLASNTPPAVIASSVAVRYASGEETASITVPSGFNAASGDTVKIVVLGATAPIACCTASGASGYSPSQFSISTSDDVVPGYPSTDEALDYVAAFLPMNATQSTISPASASAQAGSAATLTATVRDAYGNPIFNDTTAMFETSTPRDALVTPDNLPSGYSYPVSDHAGAVSYDVLDTCARAVTIGASDLGAADWDLQTPVVPPKTYPTGVAFGADVAVTFTAGPPVAPDQTTTPSDCGAPPTKSSVTVTTPVPELQWRRAYHQPAQEGIGHHLTSISCPAANFCGAVDDNGRALVYDATHWTLPQQIDSYTAGTPEDTYHANRFVGVSCPVSGFCVAMDTIGALFQYSAGTWKWTYSFVLAPADRTLALDESGTGAALKLSGPSCASSTYCVAVDSRGDTFVYRGVLHASGGLDSYPIAGAPTLRSVSCASSTTFCVTVDAAGKAYSTTDGASWSAPTAVTSWALNSVSCASARFCAVVDQFGGAATFDGTNWSPFAGAGPGGTDLASVSCPSAQFCYDSDGAYYDGTGWHIDNAQQAGYSRVSCASYAYCVKVYQDEFGTESNYESGPPIAPAGAPVDAGDTGHTATVTVVLGDAYGNPSSCQHIVLSPATSSMHASIEPVTPANPCPGAGTSGPGYSGIDGVARFHVTDDSVQDVQLGVADVTIASVWSSNAALNPSDVAQISFVAPHLVTIENVDPISPVAGAAQGATVTVRVTDVSSQPDSGRAVSLRVADDSPGRHAVVPTTTVPTDAQGHAVFRVTDPRAETIALEAVDASGLTSTETSITYTNGGLSVDAGSSAALADNHGQQPIGFSLTDVDANHTPIAGCVLVQATVHAWITAPNNDSLCSSSDPRYPSDPELQKRYVWTQARSAIITDNTPENVTVTLTAVDFQRPGAHPFPPCSPPFQAKYYAEIDTTYCVVIANTALRFVAAPTTLALAPASGEVPGDGVAQLPVTVTAKDAAGDPIAGVPVYLCPGRAADVVASRAACASPADGSLEIGPGDGATAAGQAEEQITGAGGEATFVVDGRNDGGANVDRFVTPRYSSDVGNLDLQPLSCPVSCAATDITLTPTEAGSSNVVPHVPNPAPADGKTAVTVTVTLQIGLQDHLGGHVVVLRTDSGSTTVKPKDANGAITKSNGTVRFNVADTTAETVRYSALDASTGTTVTVTPQSVFSKPEASASNVTVDHKTVSVGSPTNPTAVTVSVALRDASGQPVANAATGVVATEADGSTSATAHLVPASAQTNAQGLATFTLTDSVAESVTLVASDVRDAAHPVVLAQQPVVTFSADVYSQSIVRASPVTVQAGIGSTTLTVDLRDGGFQPVRGWTVGIPNPGSATVTPVGTNVSDANGQVRFTVSDPRAEYFCATPGAPNCLQVAVTQPHGTPQLIVQEAAIDFVPTEASESSVRASAAEAAVNQNVGLTITLRDSQRHPLAGHTASLSGCGTTLVCKVKTAGGQTTAKGLIKYTVTSHSAQAVIVTVTDSTSGVRLATTVALSFVPASEVGRSKVAASPATPSVGVPATVSVVLLDGLGRPLVAHAVSLARCGPAVKKKRLTPGGVTRSDGSVEFSLTASAPASCAIAVTDTTAGVTLAARPVVTFVA